MRILDMDTNLPMMSINEIKIIDELIEKNQPKRCFEWGSGNSTVYFPKNHNCIEEWIAMEDKKVYTELLNDKLPSTSKINVAVDPNEYVNYPLDKGKFDFILVDGNYRDNCLEIAFKIVNENGIILLHDCDRIESKDMMKKYKDKVTKLSDGELMQSTGFCAHRGIALFKI